MTALADWLTLAAEQLSLAQERVNKAGVTADDMEALGGYLVALSEHGYHLCALALCAVEHAPTGHPVGDIGHGTNLQADLAHTSEMFHAVIHFAHEVREAADAMNKGEDNS